MLQVDGYPLYQLGYALAVLMENINRDGVTHEQIAVAVNTARYWLQFLINQSVLPQPTKNMAAGLVPVLSALLDEQHKAEPVTLAERGGIVLGFVQFQTVLANDLHGLELFFVTPKFGYRTVDLILDANVIFPESIRAAMPEKVKEDIQQAGRCLAFYLPTAMGFHVLRAIELIVLDYFTIPGWDRGDADTWVGYAKVLRRHKVHRKIVAMVERLASLHRNELMHAEAVLTVEEAGMLFALVQEVLPVMIADVAKRKGSPIANFPVLNDPRWQS